MSKRNVYKGHRYVPKIMGEWNQEETYEGLSIVTNKGTSYTSKKRVPVGIDILDEEYWVVTGNYNAQVENYRQEVRELDNRISENTLDINTNKLNIEIKADKTDVEEINQQLLTKASQDDLIDVIDNLSEVIDDQHQFKNESETALGQLQVEKKNKMENIIYLADIEKLPNESDDEHINRALQTLDGSGFESWGYVAKDGTLVLEGKTYHLSGPIFMQPYQTLKGAGHATVLNMENSSSTIIDFQKPSESYYNYGVTIENLTLLGNNLNVGIELRDSSHVNIKNVFIYETFIGIQGTDVWLAHFERVTVRNYNQRGEYGFKIDGGTSNTYTATWAENIKKGYQMWSWYSTMNSPACDNFTEYAYDIGQTATLNSPGAEKGTLTDGGYVFGGWARGVTINSPLTLNVTSSGTNGNASVFFFRGTYGTVSSYRHFGTVPLTNVRLCITEGDASVTFDNPMAYRTDDKTDVLNRNDAVVLIRELHYLMSYARQEAPFQVLNFRNTAGG